MESGAIRNHKSPNRLSDLTGHTTVLAGCRADDVWLSVRVTIDPSAGHSRTVLRRGSIYTLGVAAPVLANGAVTPFATRLLGVTGYGVVATSLVVIQVGMILCGLGLATAITRHGILETSGVAGSRSLVRRGAGAAVVIGAVAVALSGPLGSVTGLDRPMAFALSAISAAAFSVIVNSQSYLRVLDRAVPFVLLSLGAALGGPLLGLLALAARPSGGATLYLTGVAAGYVLTAVGGLLLSSGPGGHLTGDTRRALRIGAPTIPHQVAIYLASGSLVLLASHLFDTGTAGRLQLAVFVGAAPGVVTSSLNNAWAPVVFRTEPSGRGAVLERTGRDIAALTALIAGGTAMVAPLALRVLAPAAYDPAAMTPAVGLAAVGSVLSVMYLANVHLVFAEGRSQGLALVTPAALALGVVAAAAAARATDDPALLGVGMAVTYACMALGVALLARRVSATRWKESRLAAPTAVGIGLCLLGASLPTDTPWLVARSLACALLGVLAILVLRRAFTR